MSEGAYDGMPGGLPEPRKLPGKRREKDTQATLALPQYEVELRTIKALRMHKLGYSYEEIAEDMGYKSAATVSAMIKNALKTASAAEVADYREWFMEEGFKQLGITAGTIQNPGYRYDIKGSPLVSVTGRWELDLDTRTKAQTEYRHMMESMRRLIGTDAPTQRHVTVEQGARQDMINKLVEELRRTPVPPAITTGYTAEIVDNDIVDAVISDDSVPAAPPARDTPPGEQQDPEDPDEDGQSMGD